MHKIKLFFILLLLFPLQTLGQGLPRIQSYKTSKYGGGEQNWDIYIDKSNIVYFSHNDGITTFDGKKWEHINDSNISLIRCLSMGADNKLYAGGHSEFGYFKPNQLGKLEYTSLMDRFVDKELQFSNLWSVSTTSSNITIVADDKVLLYDMDSIRVIKSDCKHYRAYSVFNNTVLFSKCEGVLMLSETEFIPLPKLEVFKDDVFILITEFTNNQILICSELSGVWIYNFGAALTNQEKPYLKKIETTIDNNFKSELIIDMEYDSLRNTIHICTMTTLYSLDTLGNTKSILGYDQGVVGKYIYSLKCDRLGNVWIGAGNGVSYIHMASPLRFIDNRLGDPEHTFDMLLNHDYSYFTNMGGLSFIQTEDLFSLPAKPLKQLIVNQNGGWGIHSLNNRVFVLLGFELLEMAADKVKSIISTADGYTITDYSQKDQILFIGGIDNSRLLDLKNKNSTTEIENLTGTVEKVIEIGEYHVIAGLYSEKLFNVYRDSTKKDIAQLIDKKLGFNAAYGIPVLIDSNAYICASNGLYKIVFNKDKSVDTLFLDENFEQFKELKKNLLQITLDTALDGYWATTKKELMFIKNHNNKPSELIKNPFKIVPTSELIMLFENFVVTLFVDGICFYDKNKPTLDTIKFYTIFREIQFGEECVFKGFYPFEYDSYNMKIKQPIEYDKNNLKVNFISPYYFYQDSIRYECILENFDKEWIDLGSNAEKEYTNIPPGNYCFKVRSINVFDSVSEVAELHFSISTPWYLTTWMISIYIIVAIIVLILTIKLYTYSLKKQNERLEKTILSRTKELQQKALNISEQNEKIKVQNEQIKEQSREIEFANKQLSQLSAVAQQTDNGVLIIKYPNSIQYINNGMLKMLEIENFKNTDSQQNREILLRLQNLTKVLQMTLETSEPNVFEAIVTTFKNQKKWMQITVSPVYEFELQTDKVVVICTDISDIKLAEEEISQQREELYSQSELLKSANIELEKANQLMLNSMTYAQRIQKSMLPDIKEIRAVFTDTFIFFKPKDIVSGDFYWFNQIDDSYIIIVADCTGHGVPGAFMSMIGNTLLKDTVSHKIQNPAQILTHLNDGIRTILRQKGEIDNIQNDGMDITVCIYNPELKEIQIASANHRTLLIKKDEINIIEGDIFAVGGIFTHRIPVKYTYKQYSIEKGDVMYMYTDGFQDQLGGTDYSKYGGSEFLNYLATIYKEPFKKQLSKLENEFLTWKNNKKQTDDILIWGIKF